jgi:threonine dehydratase
MIPFALPAPNAGRSVTRVFADVTADDVRRAAARLRGIARRTALRPAPSISERVGADVWVKLENEQLTGSFKLRGAYNAIASLSSAERTRGVVTASAGNHGRGVALAAQRFGIQATIFAPRTAPRVKVNGMRQCRATVDLESAHYDDAHARAIAFAAEHEMTYVDPCVGAPLVAGQGTVALEMLEQLPDVRSIIVPVGGAGLLGGIGAYVRALAPQVRIIGAQSVVTNALALSLAAERVIDIPVVGTLADGLAGGIDAHALDVGRHALDVMVTVSEEDIARAVAMLARDEDVVAEGAGAVGVAALLSEAITDAPSPVVVVISGGNIDQDTLERILSEF